MSPLLGYEGKWNDNTKVEFRIVCGQFFVGRFIGRNIFRSRSCAHLPHTCRASGIHLPDRDMHIELWKDIMVSVQVTNQDLKAISTEVPNLPGTLFAGASPLFRHFLGRLEGLLPPEKRGRGPNYVSSTLSAHVESVKADENGLWIDSEDRSVEITRDDMEEVLDEKYPSFDHQSLNLPGLLFLQSGAMLQACILQKLGRDHDIRIPGGQRTHRYVFHTTVASIRANSEMIDIVLDLDRLPALEKASANATR